MSTYRTIKTPVFNLVTQVRLYDETIEHAAHHLEVPAALPCVVDAVTAALIRPLYIEISYSNSFVYVDVESSNASGDPLRVPVKVISGTEARVKTYFFSPTPAHVQIVYRRGA